MEKYESGDTLCCVDFTRDQENQTDRLNLIHMTPGSRWTICRQYSYFLKLYCVCCVGQVATNQQTMRNHHILLKWERINWETHYHNIWVLHLGVNCRRKTAQDCLLVWKDTAVQQKLYVTQWFIEILRKHTKHKAHTCQCHLLTCH